jgi:programmed cell death protein 5
MENLNAVNPNELPEGFSTVDPNNQSGGGGPMMQQPQQQHSEADFKKQAIAEQKQMILEQALERDALARLSRIKMVKPAKAEQVENAIVAQAMSGKLPGPITEAKLIEILERKERATAQSSVAAASSSSGTSSIGGSGGGGNGGIQIQRKRYNMDSDDEDDDDDDDV